MLTLLGGTLFFVLAPWLQDARPLTAGPAYIVYVSAPAGQSTGDIRLYDVNAGAQVELPGIIQDRFPEISRNGRWIVFDARAPKVRTATSISTIAPAARWSRYRP